MNLNGKEFIEIDEYKPWLSGKTPSGYWKIDRNKKMALKWLFEEILQWTDEDIKRKLTKKHFSDNKLIGMLKNAFGSSPYRAVEFYSNGRIKPWELKVTPMNFFDEVENQIAALKWLFEEKLNWSDDDFKEKLSLEVFLNNGLGAILKRYDNYFEALEVAYPNRFNAWEVLDYVPEGYWEIEENRLKALNWLFKKQLNWNEEQIKKQINAETFNQNKLSGLFQLKYNASPYEVIKELYGEKYKPWELTQVPRGFWQDKQNQEDAIKWLIEEKCKGKEIEREDFENNGLISLLIAVFNGSVKNAISSIQ